MFQRILLPLDLTDKHAVAVDHAVELASGAGASITLFHVIELIQGLARAEEKSFYEGLERKAQKHLERIGKTLSAKNVNCNVVIQFGHRVEETVRYAMEQSCDLILLTSPKFDPAHPVVGWSSMSLKISVLAPIPVLLVKG